MTLIDESTLSDPRQKVWIYRRYDSYDFNGRSTKVRSRSTEKMKIYENSLKDGEGRYAVTSLLYSRKGYEKMNTWQNASISTSLTTRLHSCTRVSGSSIVDI
mmetsp:Transcript_3428/g.3991  ORF Transcript_3428/g.3991 Transcript_3428/m.3991 type:complete len:102 (+) Transcript_3428:73-378(+)